MAMACPPAAVESTTRGFLPGDRTLVAVVGITGGRADSAWPQPAEVEHFAVKRRADVVGILHTRGAISGLVGAVWLGTKDEWQLQHRLHADLAGGRVYSAADRRFAHPNCHPSGLIHSRLSYTPIVHHVDGRAQGRPPGELIARLVILVRTGILLFLEETVDLKSTQSCEGVR